MYDNYPEWGPASHHPENRFSYEATQEALAQREAAGYLPEDN